MRISIDYNRILPLATAGMLLFELIVLLPLQVLSHNYLYADGSYFLLMIMSSQGVTTFDWPRQFAHLLMQLPVVISIKFFNVTNINVLSCIYGTVLHILPLLGVIISWFLLKDSNKRLYLAGVYGLYCFSSINTSAFIISESHVAAAIFWILLSILVCVPESFSMGRKILLVFCSVLSLRLYESYVLLGLILATLIIVQLLQLGRQWERSAKITLLFCSLTLLSSSAIALGSLLNPRDKANFSAIVSSLNPGTLLDNVTLILSGLIVAVALGFGFVSAFLGDKPRTVGRLFLVCAASVGFLGLLPVLPGFSLQILSPVKQYQDRFLNMLIPAAFGIFIILFYVISPRGREPIDNVFISRMAMVAILALFVWNAAGKAAGCVEWNRYKDRFVYELKNNNGIVDVSKTKLYAMKYNWNYTVQTLSIVLNAIYVSTNIGTIITNEQVGWQPFKIVSVDSMPNLSRYGIDYSYTTK